jgi:hypothetical protein
VIVALAHRVCGHHGTHGDALELCGRLENGSTRRRIIADASEDREGASAVSDACHDVSVGSGGAGTGSGLRHIAGAWHRARTP